MATRRCHWGPRTLLSFMTPPSSMNMASMFDMVSASGTIPTGTPRGQPGMALDLMSLRRASVSDVGCDMTAPPQGEGRTEVMGCASAGRLRSPRGAGSCRQAGNDLLKAGDDAGHAVVAEPVRPVSTRVVQGVSEERCVRDHECRIALAPEGPMVRPADPRDEARDRPALRRVSGVASEQSHRLPYEPA